MAENQIVTPIKVELNSGKADTIELTDSYKYHGIKVSVGNRPTIFKHSRKNITINLQRFKTRILASVKQSAAPIQVALALWQQVAIPTIIYGIEVVSTTKVQLNKLDSIQYEFARQLMGIHRKLSQTAILYELGLRRISAIGEAITEEKQLICRHCPYGGGIPPYDSTDTRGVLYFLTQGLQSHVVSMEEEEEEEEEQYCPVGVAFPQMVKCFLNCSCRPNFGI